MLKNSKMQHYSLPWRELPGVLPQDEELVVIGDVHGQAHLLDAVLSAIHDTPKELPQRRLVFLGDLIDRGPASISEVAMPMECRERAKADHLNILPGNHDLMLLDVLRGEENVEHWLGNGGRTVLTELGLSWPETPWIEIVALLKSAIHPEYLDLMEFGQTHLKFGDLILVHAGLDPHADLDDFLALDRREIRTDEHWATARYPFLSWKGGWDKTDADPERREQRPTIVVHGHTPALRSNLTSSEDLSVCDGIDDYRALDLDIGAAYRPQLAWGHFRKSNEVSDVQVHGLTARE